MKKIIFTTVIVFCLAFMMEAQEKRWTMEECMQYAVENSPAVKQKKHLFDSNKADRVAAFGAFLPSISASSAAYYNYGRSIDPETNIYNNTTTFNNSYSLNADIPLFRGGQLVNQWRLSQVGVQAGKNDIQKAKDDLAIQTMGAFVDVVYYYGTKQHAADKLEETKRVLYKTQREEALGLKGKADLAQFEAQLAEDDYNLIRQQNQYKVALLTLKEYMNYPYDEELLVDTAIIKDDYQIEIESIENIYQYATISNPTAIQAELSLKESRMRHLIQKGRYFPSLSFGASVGTSYYDNLKSEVAPPSFKSQFKNNRGEQIYFSISIPIFSRMDRITSVRKARNDVRIAEEQKTEILRQLQTAVEKAVQDRNGYAKETIQMEKKEEADSYAYRVTLRKYEEGLMSPIDLQTSANTLLLTKANLLQRRLMYVVKSKEVDYYKGTPLVDEE